MLILACGKREKKKKKPLNVFIQPASCPERERYKISHLPWGLTIPKAERETQ